MRKMLVLARRELAGYFFSPIAYIIGALFLAGSGAYFFGVPVVNVRGIFEPGDEASMRPLFEAMAGLMVFVMPLLTMRLISEELHTNTIETLLTAPVTDAQVIGGKFLGVMGFYLALLAATATYIIPMLAYAQVDLGVVAMGYVGMVLLGAAFAAVGLVASAMTRYQLLAAVLAATMLALVSLLPPVLARYAWEPWNHLALRISAMAYFRDFARGVLDTRAVVYFLSITALMLFLGVKTLESRRWR